MRAARNTTAMQPAHLHYLPLRTPASARLSLPFSSGCYGCANTARRR